MDFFKYNPNLFFKYRYYFENQFKSIFEKHGYTFSYPHPVSSKIDPSVRFIGSITSVFKKHIKNELVLGKGVFSNQGCLKTRMLQKEIIKRSSYYPCQGILTNYSALQSITGQTFNYIFDVFRLQPNQLLVHLQSEDTEFTQTLQNIDTEFNLIYDELEKERYIHEFGLENTKGRNIAIYTPPTKKLRRKFIATIIIIEKESIPILVEVTIKPISIIQYINQIEHDIDCYPKNKIISHNNIEYYKFQDALIVSTILFREGILPTNKSNRDRLFRKYIVRILKIMSKNNLSIDNLTSEIIEHEKRFFGNSILEKSKLKDIIINIPY